MKFKTTVSSEIRDKAFNEGIEQGKVISLVNSIQLLMKKSKLTVDEAMDFLEIDPNIKSTVLSILEQSIQ